VQTALADTVACEPTSVMVTSAVTVHDEGPAGNEADMTTRFRCVASVFPTSPPPPNTFAPVGHTAVAKTVVPTVAFTAEIAVAMAESCDSAGPGGP
jgi:hypothetical protein